MALADAIRRFAKSYSVSRPVDPTYIDGRAVPGDPLALTIAASIQPAGGRDLLLLEEGSRVKSSIVILTPDVVQALDVVTWSGEGYQVEHVEPWTDVGGFYRAIATKVAP